VTAPQSRSYPWIRHRPCGIRTRASIITHLLQSRVELRGIVHVTVAELPGEESVRNLEQRQDVPRDLYTLASSQRLKLGHVQHPINDGRHAFSSPRWHPEQPFRDSPPEDLAENRGAALAGRCLPLLSWRVLMGRGGILRHETVTSIDYLERRIC